MTAATAVDAALAAFADEVGSQGPVTVEGRRTAWHVGGSPAPDTRFVRAPVGVVEHTPAEMTVRVRAGTEVAELHAALAEHGQRSALPERGGTVGGAVAVGHNDHRMPGRGALRAAVLQVRYVSADGRVVTGGGPTVKNVTGFDLPRLLTGSLGTLGCLAEVILRTNPVPAVTQWYRATDADPFVAYKAVLAPGAVLWDGTTTWVQLEGHVPDVHAQADALAAVGAFVETEEPPTPSGHRWSVRPADVRSLPQLTGGAAFVAAVGVGLAFAAVAQPERSIPPAVAALNRRVKDLYDPTGRLNPGRRVAGT